MSAPGQQGPASIAPPQKSIRPDRDRFQSHLVTAISLGCVLLFLVLGLLANGEAGGRYQVTAVSLLFAGIAFALRSATLGGAVSGALVCFLITWWTRDLDQPLLRSALIPLLCLFLLTWISTRLGRARKQARGLAERHGGRTASQVMANLAVAALVVTPAGAYAGAAFGLDLPISALLLATACLAALAEATADTVSSEIGQAFGEKTYLLTNLRRVRRGTDGGISLLGTIAGLFAALLVTSVGAWPLHLSPRSAAVALGAAILGLFTDSLLGATLERRGWIGNDVVNLSSTAVAALAVFALTRLSGLLR